MGEKDAVGFNLNFSLNVKSQEYFGDERYLFIFERAIFPIIKSFQPDLIFIKNNLNCLYGDQYGKLHLTGNCMYFMYKKL